MIPCISQATTLPASFADDATDYPSGGCTAVEVWLTKLEKHLKHFPPDSIHLQIVLERHPKKPLHSAALNLRVPSNILHSEKSSADVIKAFEAFYQNPRPGEVYNIGGGRDNSASVLESIQLIEELIGRKVNFTYVEQNRIGDHICYISDLRKLRSHFPGWNITRSLRDICTEIIASPTASSVSTVSTLSFGFWRKVSAAAFTAF